MNLKELIVNANKKVSTDPKAVLAILKKNGFEGTVEGILDFIRENHDRLDENEQDLEEQFAGLREALQKRDAEALKMTMAAVAAELLPEKYHPESGTASTAEEPESPGEETMNEDHEKTGKEQKEEAVSQEDIDGFFADDTAEGGEDEEHSVSQDDIEDLLQQTEEGASESGSEAGQAVSEDDIDKIMEQAEAAEGTQEDVKPAEEDTSGGKETAEDAAAATVAKQTPEAGTEGGAEAADKSPVPDADDAAADQPKEEALEDEAPGPQVREVPEEKTAPEDAAEKAGEPEGPQAPDSDDAIPAESESPESPAAGADETGDRSVSPEPVSATGDKNAEERIADERYVLYLNVGDGPQKIAESPDKEKVKEKYLGALKKHSQNQLFIEKIVRKEVVVVREEKEVVNLSLNITF